MKYLFSILFVLMFGLVQAQTIYTFTGTDTIAATATVNLDLTVRSGYDVGIFQVILTEVSGATDGTCILKWSVDGSNYVTVPDSDTLEIADVTTQSFIWTETFPKAPYYRIACTGVGGTMLAIASGKAHFKKD